jgi:hypothetical protein
MLEKKINLCPGLIEPLELKLFVCDDAELKYYHVEIVLGYS